MRPITRETIMDRRQPVMRWSAVFAGAAVAVALWVLLQMLGMGVGLIAVNVDDAGTMHDVGLGTTIWTLAVPFIAMLFGGLVAGRLAGSVQRSIGALHGLVVWALTSFVGIYASVALASLVVPTDFEPTPESTAKVLLGTGIASAVALVMGVLGGAAGVRKNGHGRRVKHDTLETVSVPPPAPIP